MFAPKWNGAAASASQFPPQSFGYPPPQNPRMFSDYFPQYTEPPALSPQYPASPGYPTSTFAPPVSFLTPPTSAQRRSFAPNESPPISPQQIPYQMPLQGVAINSPESSDKFKTELCRKFTLTGYCRYAEMCQFAHGPGELRALMRHPLYKTSSCKSFESTGTCRYGARCRFIHDENNEELATLARGVPALNFQVSEPSVEEVEAATIDAVQHMSLGVPGVKVSPHLVPSSNSSQPASSLEHPGPLALDKGPNSSSPSTEKLERTLTMIGRVKTAPSELSKVLNGGNPNKQSTPEIRTISSLIFNQDNSNSSSSHSQTSSKRPREPRQTLNATIKIEEDVFVPADLDARRLPVASSGSWVNLAEITQIDRNIGYSSPSSPVNSKPMSAKSIKHSLSQPALAMNSSWSVSPSIGESSRQQLKNPSPANVANLPALPPTSPLNGNGSNSGLNFAEPLNFKKAASYANHIWFEASNNDVDKSSWPIVRAKSVEGRLDIFRNLSDTDLVKTGLLSRLEEKSGEVGLILSEDEDRTTDHDNEDYEEDEAFSVGKF